MAAQGYPFIEQNTPAGADLVNDRALIENRFLYGNVSTATTTVIKSGGGVVREILVLGGTLGAVTVYDNTAASGTQIIVPTVTPIQGATLIRDVEFYTGLTILTAAATVIVVSYR